MASAQLAKVVELAAIAGGGANAASEEVIGYTWFYRDWLESHGIDVANCAVIGVRGLSMWPTLPDGCAMLVDRSQVEVLPDKMYVFRSTDGLIVKRVVLSDDGDWLLAGHPDCDPVPFPDDAEIVGQVAWSGRLLRMENSE